MKQGFMASLLPSFPVSEKKNTKDIWDVDEVQDGAEFESNYDPRPQPESVLKITIIQKILFLLLSSCYY